MTLANAYDNLFRGNATQQEAEMVLVDLANFSGFYGVADPRVDDLSYEAGRRSVFARVYRFMNLSAEERASLEMSARHERVADHEEGQI